MVTGYVSQVRPYKSTGDCCVSVEVIKEHWLEAATLNLEKVVILTEREYVKILEAGREEDTL